MPSFIRAGGPITAFPIVLLVSIALGTGFAGISGALETKAFLQRAQRVEGVVVDQVARPSKGRDVYYPRVQYTVPSESDPRAYVAASGSSRPAYRIGERVTVLLDPLDLQAVRLDRFWETWAFSLVMGLFALTFGTVGTGFLIRTYRERRLSRRLKAEGQAVPATVVALEENYSFRINGSPAHVLVCESLDPEASARRRFRSEPAWFAAISGLKGSRVTVYVDPQDRQRHLVDLSTLQSTL